MPIYPDYVGADKYEWYRVETAGDVLVSGATSKDYSPATNDANDYYVVITVGGSTAQSNAVSITYNDKPDITLDATASICQDGTLALNPSFTGGVITSYSIHYTKLYDTVDVEDANGCKTNGTLALTEYTIRDYIVPSQGVCGSANAIRELVVLAKDNDPRITSYNVCYTKLLRQSLW